MRSWTKARYAHVIVSWYFVVAPLAAAKRLMPATNRSAASSKGARWR